MKKILLQKEREDSTSSHKLDQLKRDSSNVIDTSIGTARDVQLQSRLPTVPSVPPLLFTVPPLISARPPSTDLKSLCGNGVGETMLARPEICPRISRFPESAIGTGVTAASNHLDSTPGITVANRNQIPDVLTQHFLSSRPAYYTADAHATSTVRHSIDVPFLHQYPQTAALSLMSSIGKLLPPPFGNNSHGIVETGSDRMHISAFADLAVRYPGTDGSSCASNMAEESVESTRDMISEDSRQEFDDNTSDELLQSDGNAYPGDASTRDTDSPNSRPGSEPFKSPASMRSARGRYHSGRTSRSSSSVGTSRSSGKTGSEGPGGGRSIIRCPICGKLFNNSSALAKHKLTHSDERKYTCATCSKSFKRQDHLNGHMMTHSSKKPFECKFIGCSKSYCDARSLRRHLENHHQDFMNAVTAGGSLPEPHVDQSVYMDVPRSETANGVRETDGRSSSPFDPKQIWTTGINPLDEPKPVKCHICNRGFKNIAALNGHMRLHGGYVRKENAEGSEINEPMDTSFPMDGHSSRGPTPHSDDASFAIAPRSTSRLSGMMMAGGQSFVSESFGGNVNESIVQSDSADRAAFAAVRYYRDEQSRETTRSTEEIPRYKMSFPSSLDFEHSLQTSNASTRESGKQHRIAESERARSAHSRSVNSISMNGQASKEYEQPRAEAVNLKRHDKMTYGSNPRDLLQRVHREAKNMDRTSDPDDVLLMRNRYGEQNAGVEMHRSTDVKMPHYGDRSLEVKDKREYFTSRNLSGTIAESSSADVLSTAGRNLLRFGSGGITEHETHGNRLDSFPSQMSSSLQQLYDISKLLSTPALPQIQDYRMSAKEILERRNQTPPNRASSKSDGRYSSPNLGQTFETRMTLDEKPFAVSRLTSRSEMVQPAVEAFHAQPSDSAVMKSIKSENGKVTNAKADEAERNPISKLVLSIDETGKAKHQPLSSPESDSLYRRRVKNLMLKQGDVELATDVKSETALNSPRLPVPFDMTIPDTGITGRGLSNVDIRSGGAHPKDASLFDNQQPIATAFCESGSPSLTRPKSSSVHYVPKKSTEYASKCAVECGMQTSACCERSSQTVESQAGDCGTFGFMATASQQNSLVGHYCKTSLPCGMESHDVDCRRSNAVNSGSTACETVVDVQSKCCLSLQNRICSATQYQVGCAQLRSRPSTPSCADVGYTAATRLLGCCSRTQSAGSGYSDVAVMECVHGQRTPVLLHYSQKILCPSE